MQHIRRNTESHSPNPLLATVRGTRPGASHGRRCRSVWIDHQLIHETARGGVGRRHRRLRRGQLWWCRGGGDQSRSRRGRRHLSSGKGGGGGGKRDCTYRGGAKVLVEKGSDNRGRNGSDLIRSQARECRQCRKLLRGIPGSTQRTNRLCVCVCTREREV